MALRLATLLLAATLSTGCAVLRTSRPAPARAFGAAVAEARIAADSGRGATAGPPTAPKPRISSAQADGSGTRPPRPPYSTRYPLVKPPL